MAEAKFSELLRQTLTKVSGKVGDEEIVFVTDRGITYKLYYEPD